MTLVLITVFLWGRELLSYWDDLVPYAYTEKLWNIKHEAHHRIVDTIGVDFVDMMINWHTNLNSKLNLFL